MPVAMKHSLGVSPKMPAYQKMVSVQNSTDGLEVKSGRLCLLRNVGGKLRRINVFVRVYRGCFEHYAVLYKDQKYANQSGYISLKNSVVTRCDERKNVLRVTVDNYEGNELTFESSSGLETEDWLSAFQSHILSSSPPKSSIAPSLSPVIPRTPLMPTLEEESDEDD